MNSNQNFERGRAKRSGVLGEAYVSEMLDGADSFNRPFQELVTEYCWGMCWGDVTLPDRDRSLLNLGMIAASNRMHEWELHFRGALKNGLSVEQLQAVLIQIAVYCGIPTGVECFRIATRVLAERTQEKI